MIYGRPDGVVGTRPDPPARTDYRRIVCSQCPSMRMRFGTMWCGEPLIGAVVHEPARKTCGCSITLKTLLPITDCPQGKWNKVVSHG